MSRLLDDSFPLETRRHILAVTVARLNSNACFRFAPPFLASISRDFEISLSRLGVALMITELVMAIAPILGAFVDRIPRRTAMTAGLIGVSGAATLAAVSQSVWLFVVGITVLGLAKFVFDIGMTAWVNDHVDYERRGRVIGITETSWALGLLIGVTIMGLVASATSWRWGYIVGALSVAVMAVVIAMRLGSGDAVGSSRHKETIRHRLPRRGLLIVAAMFFLMASSQTMFVTFGSWLADDFSFSDAGIAGVVFALGAFELVASLTSAHRTDVWGKERSTIAGALLIVPSGILLLLAQNNVWLGLALLAIFLLGFEFAIVSLLPIAANIIPGAPGRGLGFCLGGGTLGRALMSVVATASYDAFGFGIPAVIGAICAAGVAICVVIYTRLPAPVKAAQ
jgi:predicted MFS family arabinose efflux permease